MAVTVTILAPKYIENAQATQYTSPAQTVALLDKLTVTNVTASTATFSVNLVPSGGAAGAGNLIIQTQAIPPGQVYLCPELIGQAVANGGFISAVASAASALVIAGTFREIT